MQVTGLGLESGGASAPERTYVGPPEHFDRVSAMQFNLLTSLGLRGHHHLLDIGCGSLRAGRLFVVYLEAGHYHGLEPQRWLVESGIQNELGSELVARKRPAFRHDEDFVLSAFGRRFDYLLAHSIFSHASQSQILRCLHEARRVLVPGGLFCATFLPGAVDYSGADWIYPSCVTYREETLVGLADEAGLGASVLRWGHPNGQRWVAFWRRDSGEPVVLRELGNDPATLRWSLELTRRRLEDIERHPVVRLGRRLNWTSRRLRRRGSR